jgi:Domain of unknown function (DUF3846)
MMITAIVLPVDPNEPIRLEQLDQHDPSAYSRLVGGGPFEVANLERPEASLYFDEEGKRKDFPVNARATTLLWAHNGAFRGRDMIVGPAFIVGPVNRHGDDRTVPDDLVDLLLHTKRYRVQVQTESDTRWNEIGEVFTEWLEPYVYAVQLAQREAAVQEVRVVPELDDELRKTWFMLGRDNPWIREAYDPPFRIDSFVGCFSIEELEEKIGHGNWSLGSAFYYQDLCFINQVNGGDEWLTIRHGIAFESITFSSIIERGEFASFIRRLLAASKEQCQDLRY